MFHSQEPQTRVMWFKNLPGLEHNDSIQFNRKGNSSGLWEDSTPKSKLILKMGNTVTLSIKLIKCDYLQIYSFVNQADSDTPSFLRISIIEDIIEESLRKLLRNHYYWGNCWGYYWGNYWGHYWGHQFKIGLLISS